MPSQFLPLQIKHLHVLALAAWLRDLSKLRRAARDLLQFITLMFAVMRDAKPGQPRHVPSLATALECPRHFVYHDVFIH